MIKIFKNRIAVGSALFGILDLIQGFVIASPILIYLRILYENTDSALHLWPLPSAEIVTDFMINHNDVFIFYIITAVVLYILFFFMKSFFIGGIYRLIIIERQDSNSIKTASDFLKISSQLWAGFLKAELFSVAIYGLAIFLGLVFGDFLGRLWGFLRLASPALFIFLGSTYLQILKVHMAFALDNSLKAALRETRERIAGALVRIIIGNASVFLAAVLILKILWFVLKAIKSSEWSVVLMILAILVQQMMALVVCLAQALRINFNFSVIKKGE